MRVFVTGASGHIGSLVVPELLAAGHEVVGLARSAASAAALEAAGAQVHRGSLDDLDSLRAGATEADGVIHLAYIHDFSDYAGAATTEMRAVQTIGVALEGTGKPFVMTSGVAGLLPGRVLTEAYAPEAGQTAGTRFAAESAVIALAGRGVRSAAVRLAPSVHGPADHHGFVPALIGVARRTGFAAYVGDGDNRWPAVHDLDAAHLYLLALESAPAGTRLHGIAEEGVPFREIAEAIGRHLDLPVTRIAPEEATAHFGFLGGLVGLDIPASSTATQELLGWRPIHASLMADLDEGHYFDTPAE